MLVVMIMIMIMIMIMKMIMIMIMIIFSPFSFSVLLPVYSYSLQLQSTNNTFFNKISLINYYYYYTSFIHLLYLLYYLFHHLYLLLFLYIYLYLYFHYFHNKKMLNEYNPQVLEDLIDVSRNINDWESGIQWLSLLLLPLTWLFIITTIKSLKVSKGMLICLMSVLPLIQGIIIIIIIMIFTAIITIIKDNVLKFMK